MKQNEYEGYVYFTTFLIITYLCYHYQYVPNSTKKTVSRDLLMFFFISFLFVYDYLIMAFQKPEAKTHITSLRKFEVM
jgi:hypothetical protein